jgi:hypothetical protein
METRRAIVVLGSPRSGTSALTRVLSFYGLSQAVDLLPPGKHNPKGFWESLGCKQLNDRILASLGGQWDDPGPFLLPGLTVKESRNAIALDLAERWGEHAMNALRASFGGASAIVLKDPRICLLLPLWRWALEHAGYRPYFVLAYRNPLEVAASLSTLNRGPFSRAVRLWVQYNLEALITSADLMSAAVAYDDLLHDPDTALAPLFASLSPAVAALSPGDRAARTEFLSAADRHYVAKPQGLERSPVVAGLVKQLWQLLLSWQSTAPSARIAAVQGLQSSYEDAMLVSGAARMARNAPVGEARIPARPSAQSSGLPSAPRARLFTTFGTVVYVHAAGQLQHGAIESSPANALFVADPSWTGTRPRGHLVHEREGVCEPIACSPSRCISVSKVERHDGSMMQTSLEIVSLERRWIALTGGGLFLHAEADGRVTLSGTVSSIWEAFWHPKAGARRVPV